MEIFLKRIKKDSLKDDFLLIDKINRSEDQIKNGKLVKADTSMSYKDIDEILMK